MVKDWIIAILIIVGTFALFIFTMSIVDPITTKEQYLAERKQECDLLKSKGIEPSARYEPNYGCLVLRGDHYEKSKW